ncbi:hypothetical protein RIF29_12067 [Crotalaria pallida]|uniref:DOG1 domain-containing protein n=1 Tax=Crotalaria pallida TaxID=3830 RepID=A0AAN9IMT0_CROPI
MKAEEEVFRDFFKAWLLQKQILLDQLHNFLATPNSETKMEPPNHLIEQVLSHYQQYMEEKNKVAESDVLLLFSQSWLSAYERALLWIGDYKPSLILRLANDSAEGLTVRQREVLEKMMGETKRAERELAGKMATVQETVASRQILGLARKVGRVLDGEICQLDSMVEEMKRAFVEVLKKADELRVSTVREVVGILTPSQTVQFLATATNFQLQVRKLGLQRDHVAEMSQI